ncbi:MAG: DUF11 domain-containing protein [Thermoanaerobaculia bacterium]
MPGADGQPGNLGSGGAGGGGAGGNGGDVDDDEPGTGGQAAVNGGAAGVATASDGGAGGFGGGGSSFFAGELISMAADNPGDGFVVFCEIAAEDADLSITKEATVNDDGTVSFAVVVDNLGPADATGVVVTDELPACTQFQSDGCGGSAAGGTWTWELGALSAGQSASCTLTVEGSACSGEGEQTNVASVEGAEEDPNGDNNTDQAPFEIEAEPVPALPVAALALLVALLAWIASRMLRQSHA